MERYLKPYNFLLGYICLIASAIHRVIAAPDRIAVETAKAEQRVSERAGLLLDKYGNSILRLAYSYLHNISDAEDVLQDTLIRYIESASEFESEAHEKAWLLRAAANISKNRIQYNKIRETDELMEELEAEETEDLAFVWEAVKCLPTKYQEVIHLYHQEGYSTKEIAKILGRNEATVRSDLKRGRERLKIVIISRNPE